MEFLEKFTKNAVNKFVVINASNGARLEIKGTNLEETASVFAALTLDNKKETNFRTPDVLKKGEGVIIEGNDKETGIFSIFLMIPMSKIRLPKVVKLVREFESIAKEF
jgi:hypothetical protein